MSGLALLGPSRWNNARKIEIMDMKIKNQEAYQLAKLTGESLTTAVTKAHRERLARLHAERGVDMAERLLVIGRDCAAHLKKPFCAIDHGEMLYNKRGLPK